MDFPCNWPFVQGIHRSPFFFIYACMNKRLSKQSWGWRFETQSLSLWRHYNGPSQSPASMASPLFSTCGTVFHSTHCTCVYTAHKKFTSTSTSRVTLYTAGLLHSAMPHCWHIRAPIVHTAVPRENNEHGCVYLRCRAVCKLPGCVEGHPCTCAKCVVSIKFEGRYLEN